jgi:hypothetical protein
MFLDKKRHGDRMGKVAALQIAGWAYESHCWVQNEGSAQKTCLWCGAFSSADMQVDGRMFVPLCYGNPFLRSVANPKKDIAIPNKVMVMETLLSMVLPSAPETEEMKELFNHLTPTQFVEAFEWASAIIHKATSMDDVDLLPTPAWVKAWQNGKE